MKRKTISVFLALVMMVSLIPLTAIAEDTLDPMSNDTTAPVINSAEIVNPSVTAPGKLQLKLDITEDTGVDYIWINFTIKVGDNELWRSASWSSWNNNGIPLYTGVYTLDFELDKYLPVGSCSIENISLNDTVGNYAYYHKNPEWNDELGRWEDWFTNSNNSSVRFLFTRRHFRVAQSEINDSVRPVINSVELLTPEVTSPGTVKMRVDITEAVGVSTIHFNLYGIAPNGNTRYTSLWWNWQEEEWDWSTSPATVTYHERMTTGVYELEFSISGAQPLEYVIYDAYIYDLAGLCTGYGRENSEWDYETQTSVYSGDFVGYNNRNDRFAYPGDLRVTASSDYDDDPVKDDTVAPVINSLKIETPVVSTPGLVKITLDITEDVGIQSIWFNAKYEMTGGGETHKSLYWWWNEYDYSRWIIDRDTGYGDYEKNERQTSGEYTISFRADPTFSAADYTIDYFGISDISGNSTYYYRQWADSYWDVESQQWISVYTDEFYNQNDSSNVLSFDNEFTVINEREILLYAVNGTAGLAQRIADLEVTVNEGEDSGIVLIDCSRSNTASKELFEAIAGRDINILFALNNIQWMFNGLDIEPDRCKDIELWINIWDADGWIYGCYEDKRVAVVNFANNGELPGKAEIRVFTDYMRSWWWNSGKDPLFTWMDGTIALDLTKRATVSGDEFITFPVYHNSTYVLSSSIPEYNTYYQDEAFDPDDPDVPSHPNPGTPQEPGTPPGTPQEPGAPPPDAPAEVYSIESFVTRMYEIVLGRNPSDDPGFYDWVQRLENGEISGIDVAARFFLSEEFQNSNIGNAEFVKMMYQVMLNRPPEEQAVEDYWTAKLDQGAPKAVLVLGFAASAEFEGLCASAGIDNVPKGSPAALTRGFVARLYYTCLSREPDPEGMAAHVASLMSGEKTGRQVAVDFVMGEELTNRAVTNQAFVQICYAAILGRDCTAEEVDIWSGRIAESTRDSVFTGFVDSYEFAQLCGYYGIEP